MDFSHLDKMGRELKCPICLSLLKSAAMLVCNHVFCNACIVESMRSGANCPVCKLPFRRREVRPAPHMDNLVSIYKSMEAASGLTIFTTQVAPPKNNEELQIADDRKSDASKRILMPKDSTHGKRSSKGKRKKMEKLVSTTSDPCSTRPSCSSNKRIHVTPYPISETPVQQKRSNKLAISTTEALDRTELENDGTLTYKRLEDHTLQPFFWLREANEDDGVERITTQETIGLITPKKSVPCFSDIKDSEDISTPQKATPISKSAVQEAFDSEMFEWTQSACSPELFSTPTKKQTAGGENFNGFNEDKCRAISLCLLGSPKHCHQHENARTTRISCARTGTLKKRHKKTKSKKSTGETASISLNEEHPFGSNEILEDSSQGKKSSKKMGPLRYRGKVHTKSRKPTNLHPKSCTTSILSEINELVDVQRALPASSSKAIHDIEGTSKTLAESSHSKPMDVVMAVQNKSQKRTKKATVKSPKESKRLSSDLAELEVPDTNLLGDPRKDEFRSHELDKANSRRQLSFFKQNVGQGSRRTMFGISTKFKMDAREQDDQEVMHMQNVDMLAAKTYHKEQHASINNAGQEDNLPFLNLHKSYATSKAKELLHLPTNKILRKCKNVPSPVKCAFCHSSSDSEVSGEIMHYFNGKSVALDYNEGVNVIHSHRCCAEWAPDVYFNDDLVINLSTELARSKRITCSYCGIKGAALGCFEKSCRRSFHYPCAKQTPECRWDYEHFVMLCPLHSSSKFPSETSELQKKKRKTSGSKIEVPPTSQSIDVAERNCRWAWPSRFLCKWVLCSSALSGTEKEILSKFASLTGVSVLKTWSSAVTHVIASTDENGACKRTLKFLMGILEGKWILSIEWIKACMEFKKPVDEEKYEISVDVYGIHSGPCLGRMRIANKEPKIFSSFWFYFSGDFVASYKGYLHDLIVAAGGKVLQRRPISMAHKKPPDDSSDTTFIVYCLEFSENKRNQDEKILDNRKAESIALAGDCGAKVVTNSWILDSIAASALQTLPC